MFFRKNPAGTVHNVLAHKIPKSYKDLYLGVGQNAKAIKVNAFFEDRLGQMPGVTSPRWAASLSKQAFAGVSSTSSRRIPGLTQVTATRSRDKVSV